MGRIIVRRRVVGAPAIDPATLALSGFWLDFAGSPWSGTASEGASGSRTATNAGTAPSVGTPLNGNAVASFNGVDDYLGLSSNANAYLTDETTPANGSFSGWVLFKAASAGAYSITDPYNEEAILSDNAGTVGLIFSTEGFGAYHLASVTGWKSVRAACATGGWHLGTYRYDGSTKTLAVGVDGPPNHSVFIQPADSSLSARTLHLGKSFHPSSPAFFHGDVEQIAITKDLLTDDEFRSVVSYINAHTALSLSQTSSEASTYISGSTNPASTYNGTVHTAAAGFTQRDGAKLHYMAAHNKYFLLGGWASSGRPEWSGDETTNEVYYAVPGALDTWTLGLSHKSNPPATGAGARWRRSHAFGTCQFDLGDGAGECLYVVGGDQYISGAPQVYRSNNPIDDDEWERRNAAADFGLFAGLCVGQYGTEIHVVGGCPLEASTFYTASSQHWVSEDGGTTWHRLPDAPFQTSFCTRLVEHRDYLFVVGGNGGGVSSGRVYQSDVWAWDGSQWHLQSTGEFPGGMWTGAVDYDGLLWRVMARDTDSTDDSWTGYSRDLGRTFTQVPGVPWAAYPSHADGLCAGPDGIVVASGFGVDRRVFSLVAV